MTLQPDTQHLVRSALEKAGLRYTTQRATVFACLAELDCHPTAEEIYRRVRRRLPRISLATVYKALDALAAAGLIAKLDPRLIESLTKAGFQVSGYRLEVLGTFEAKRGSHQDKASGAKSGAS